MTEPHDGDLKKDKIQNFVLEIQEIQKKKKKKTCCGVAGQDVNTGFF